MNEYMTALFSLTGQLVESSQMIEHNLAVMVYRFYDYENSDRLFDAMSEMTLGQIIKTVQEAGVLDEDKIPELNDILSFRNEMVHRFFKDNNIAKQQNNIEFLKNRCNYINKRLENIVSFNDYLVQFMDGLS